MNETSQTKKLIFFVTGITEQECITDFFREIQASGLCVFTRPEKIVQLDPNKSNIELKVTNTNAKIPSKDNEIGNRIRAKLKRNSETFGIIFDDLEKTDNDFINGKFNRYNNILKTLPESTRMRTSVHFAKPEFEAYFLADLQNTNKVLGTNIERDWDDPEECVKKPSSLLNQSMQKPGDNSQKYNKRVHGKQISRNIDLKKVLENPNHCTFLRSLVKWMVEKFWAEYCEETFNKNDFCLNDGVCAELTAGQ